MADDASDSRLVIYSMKVDGELLRLVDELAECMGVTRSEAVREALRRLLAAPRRRPAIATRKIRVYL